MSTFKRRREIERHQNAASSSSLQSKNHLNDLHQANKQVFSHHPSSRCKISTAKTILNNNENINKISHLRTAVVVLSLLCSNLLISAINCQQNANNFSTTSTGSRLGIEPNINANSTNATDPLETIILSEPAPFVDFTESPTLLFDSLNTNDSPEIKIITTTPSLLNISKSSIEIETTTRLVPSNQLEVDSRSSSTTTSPVSSSSEADDSTAPTTTESEFDSGGDPETEVDANNNSNFEPPQNVSQYMDYIERLFHDLRHQITYLFEPHIPQLIRTSQMVELSPPCSHDILRMALALRQLEPWALRMIDSSGKLPEGIFEGSFTSLGSYDQCLNILFSSQAAQSMHSGATNSQQPSSSTSTTNVNASLVTQGKYCLVNVSPFLPPKPYPFERVDRLFQEEANRRNYSKDDQLSRLSPMFYYMRFRIGICVPSTCDNSDMMSISQAASSSLRLNITIDTCRYKRFDEPASTHQLVSGSIAAIIIGLVIAATIMDYWRQSSDKMLVDGRAGEIILLGVPGDGRSEQGTTDAYRRPISRVLRVSGANKSFQVITDFGSDSCGSTKHQHQNWLTHRKASDDNQSRTNPDDENLQTSNDINAGNDVDGKNCDDANIDPDHCHNIIKSWRSFSFISNFRLYFQNKSHRPYIQHHHRTTHDNEATTTNHKFKSDNNGRDRIINCLNGIRVISLCWVIVANSYITLDPRATKGLTKTREAPRDFLFQLIVQASLAIETFFFLSGLLMSLSFSRSQLSNFNLSNSSSHNKEDGDSEVDSKKKINFEPFARWFRFYLHRYIRLTAPAMLVIAFTMFSFRYGDGPLWYEVTHRAHMSCNVNWWRHLLHVANYIDTRQMCFIHYWYIAADMQLFLIAPLLLLLLHKYTRLGLIVIGSLGFTTATWIFHTTFMRNLPPTLLFYSSDPESRREFGNTIMTKPYAHFLPYLVGMLLGHWLNKMHDCDIAGTSSRQDQDLEREVYGETSSSSSYPWFKWIDRKSLSRILACLASLLVIAEIFLPYLWNNSQLPSPLLASLYAALFRFGWALALAYLVISCRHKRGQKCRGGATASGCSSNNSKQLGQQSTNFKQQPTSLISSVSKHNNTYTITRTQASQQDWCWCGSSGSLLNKFLSLNVFNHLSRLSYIAYLIHLPLMSVFVAQTRAIFAFSHLLVIHLALSYLLMTFILSFILVHIIEFPFITLERYIFERYISGKQHK